MEICILNESNPSLVTLINECFDVNISSIDIVNTKDKNVRFLCALMDNLVIGSIMITTIFDPVKNINIYHLDYISVLCEYRNKGIATCLLNYVDDLAKKENISCIELTSNNKRHDAIRLYFKQGYIVRDTNVFYKKVDRGL